MKKGSVLHAEMKAGRTTERCQEWCSEVGEKYSFLNTFMKTGKTDEMMYQEMFLKTDGSRLN